jgi:hypothetical protein
MKLFNCGFISTHSTCGCILALATLKMDMRVAETYQWLKYNKLTFIYSGAFVVLLKRKK